MSITTEDQALLILRRIEPMLREISERVVRIEAQIPHLATKADTASKPNRGELWGGIAVMLALYAAILGGLAVLLK